MEDEREEEQKEHWCEYCKEPINSNDYVVKKGKVYHLFCFKQMNTFIDDEQYEDDEEEMIDE